jgi:hypothetical protein
MIKETVLLLAVIAVFDNGAAAPVEESTEQTSQLPEDIDISTSPSGEVENREHYIPRIVVAPLKDVEIVITRIPLAKPVQVANSIKENEEDSGYVIFNVLT